MLTDAHCHPFDLASFLPQAELERRRLGVLAAASACDMEEFTHNEKLAKEAAAQGTSLLLPCFAVHPQQFSVNNMQITKIEQELPVLEELAAQKRIVAAGECGFDLYNTAFRETEKIQEKFFAFHLETALRHDLPLVLHVRRATHKIFAVIKTLAKCKAVVFHSCPLTAEEGQALLRRGVNAFFSFGNTIINGHKQAMRSCALFPVQRLLTETDAPFQSARGKNFSHWEDLPRVIETAAALRGENAKELEAQIESNFRAVFL